MRGRAAAVSCISARASTTSTSRQPPKRGIWVANVRDANWDEVSNHVLALLLGWARGLLAFDRDVRAADGRTAGRSAPSPRGTGSRHHRIRRHRARARREGARPGTRGARLIRATPRRREHVTFVDLDGAAAALGLCLDPRAVDGRDRAPDRRARAYADEAQRVSHQHVSRRRHRSGCARGGVADPAHRRRRARRDRSRAARRRMIRCWRSTTSY